MFTDSSRCWQFSTLICEGRGGGQGLSVFYLATLTCAVTDGSHLHDDQFVLGAAEIMELLSETQGHCWIWGRKLTLLVQLHSWTTQNKTDGLRAIAGPWSYLRPSGT